GDRDAGAGQARRLAADEIDEDAEWAERGRRLLAAAAFPAAERGQGDGVEVDRAAQAHVGRDIGQGARRLVLGHEDGRLAGAARTAAGKGVVDGVEDDRKALHEAAGEARAAARWARGLAGEIEIVAADLDAGLARTDDPVGDDRHVDVVERAAAV